MSIKLNNNFEITSWLPIDTRFLLSQAEMKNMNDNRMPDKYFTICKEDGKIYLYDKSATSEGTTGKFKVLSEDVLERLAAVEAELLNCVKKNDYNTFKATIESRMSTAETNIATLQEDILGVGKKISVALDQDTYKITVSLLDKNNVVISSGTIDLPIEKLVKTARFDKNEKSLVFVCEDNSEFSVSLAGLVSDLATKSEVIAVKNLIPTKTSELTNDSGFLTAHQSLAAYRTKTEQDAIDATKQEKLIAGSGIKIEANVISATGGGGGEPAAYLKSASVNGNTLTLTNKDDTKVVFTPTGGGSYVAGDNIIIEGNVISAIDTVYDDTEIRAAVANKLDIMPGDSHTGGNAYNLPYYFKTSADADKITVTAETVTLDGNKTYGQYSMDVPAATNTKAGLMSAADKVAIESIANKQDKISDLDEIRDGAAKGATAIQEHQSLAAYALITETGNRVELELDNATYILTAKLKDKQGTLLNSASVDLPIEQLVVSGRYDAATKSLILELKNGNIITIPIGDLINGLVSQSEFDNYKVEVNTKFAEKQAKLIVGDNITINETTNKISAVDTKYTAGTNITIDANNVISATGGSSVLTQAITATQTVGGIATGTTFAAGTSIETILRQLLGGSAPVSGVKIYKGLVNTKPTTQAEIEALTLDQSKNKSDLVASAYSCKRLSPNNQFVVLAIPKSVGLYVEKVVVGGFQVGINEIEIGDYYMYVEDNPVTLSNITYEYYFAEV